MLDSFILGRRQRRITARYLKRGSNRHEMIRDTHSPTAALSAENHIQTCRILGSLGDPQVEEVMETVFYFLSFP